jgi:predicted acetyltransferase
MQSDAAAPLMRTLGTVVNMKRASAAIKIYRASVEDMPIVANLLEFYAYEFSESAQIDVGQDGRFGYEDLEDYWKFDTLHPYLMTVEGQYGGLALVQRGSLISDNPEVWDMEEFFIMRRYRRRGLGIALAKEVWGRHRGGWDIRVLDTNASALKFWSAAVEAECGKTVAPSLENTNRKQWHVFSFDLQSGA